ncbi:MAG TPA: hypothetical protein VGJ20_05735 [Xanthobacteraceae bacterium]|jgi:photosystem II stability/assembly factor-like uncharacterized protein
MSDRLLVATRKGLLTLERRRDGWTTTSTAFAGIAVTNVLHGGRDGVVYAALKHGHFGPKLHRSDDDGRAWRELPAPAFPADIVAAPSLFQIWTLASGAPQHPDRLWLGGIPAGLFRSDDRGESWQLVRSLWDVPERGRWFGGGYDEAGIHSVSPDPRDADRVFIAISCGGVWETRDRGASWSALGKGLVAPYVPPEQAEDSAVQDPHRVARCAAAPDVMWMQHHAGIYRSTDAGVHWTRLSLPCDDFGFAVAAHPRDAQTAWFVPAIKDEVRMPRDGALAVTRTSDGGDSWEILREGLPQRDAFDLIYRHGLAIDDGGSHLAMGSTTGGLWTSDNAGECWQLANAHLPPIYSVRFA